MRVLVFDDQCSVNVYASLEAWVKDMAEDRGIPREDLKGEIEALTNQDEYHCAAASLYWREVKT